MVSSEPKIEIIGPGRKKYIKHGVTCTVAAAASQRSKSWPSRLSRPSVGEHSVFSYFRGVIKENAVNLIGRFLTDDVVAMEMCEFSFFTESENGERKLIKLLR